MQPDPPNDPHVPRLAQALRDLYRPPLQVPYVVDDAIKLHAHRQLSAVRRARRIRFWTPLAAAAAIVLAVWLAGHTFVARQPQRPAVHAPEDVNQDGRINILDAFAMARHLQGAAVAGDFRDVTGDDIVDQRDVNRIAAVAVDLTRGSFQ